MYITIEIHAYKTHTDGGPSLAEEVQVKVKQEFKHADLLS
jgi:hypothetical protein